MPDTPPTRSLRPAVNAAARMQEVMKRQEDGYATSSAVALPTGSADSSAPISATVSPYPDVSDGAAAGTEPTEESALPEPAAKRRPPAARKSATGATASPTSSAVGNTTSSAVAQATVQPDPLKAAMLGLLAQPFPDTMKKGPMTVTSVKIPTPIWERLEFVRALTKKDKQEIIAEALLLYYERVQRTGGEDE